MGGEIFISFGDEFDVGFDLMEFDPVVNFIVGLEKMIEVIMLD